MKVSGVIKSTIIGGALFLLPIIVLGLLIGKALQYGKVVAEPIGKFFPLDRLVGIALVDILAILIILGLCYLAGILAKISFFKKQASRVEELMVGTVPGYTFAKTFAAGLTQADDEMGKMKPIMVRMDDMHQIAFEVERTPGGFVVAYLPGAPNPWSGTVAYFSSDRVSELDIDPRDAIKLVRVLGRGSGKFTSALKHLEDQTGTT